MFDRDYVINGIHATYAKELKEKKIFSRLIDVYMTAAVIGALNNRKKTINNPPSADTASIFADTFISEKVKCEEIFKTVILYDNSTSWTQNDKINICFRFNKSNRDQSKSKQPDEETKKVNEAERLFNDYVYGGIELLYETFGGKSDSVEQLKLIYKLIYENHLFIENKEEEDLFRSEY